MLKLLARIKAEPWAITPSYMEAILDIAQRQNASPEQVAQDLGRPLENTYAVEVRDGVAILPVNGPLFRYANLFTDISGATSYDKLAIDFARVMGDDDIRAVLLNIDSPGGEANGVSEFAEQIYQARGTKPIAAYVGGSGDSAAYWLATAADEIIIDETANVGSIGTVIAVTDTRARDEQEGISRLEIVSSQSPNKRPDPMTDQGRAQFQGWVDQLSDVFIDKVARNRGVSRATVLQDFGQGDILFGAKAVDAGMADRLGSFEETIKYLAGDTGGEAEARNFAGGFQQQKDAGTMIHITAGSASKSKPKEEHMDLETLQAEHPDLYKAVHDAGHREGVEAGEQAERARLQAIDDMALKGHEGLIAKAKFESPMTAEALAVEIIKAEKAKGSQFLADRAADAAELNEIDAGAHADADPDAAKKAADEKAKASAVAAAVRGFNARAGQKTVK